MTPEQVDQFKRQLGIADGDEWDPFAGLDVPADDLQAFLDAVPLLRSRDAPARRRACRGAAGFEVPAGEMSTQQGFGRLAGRHRPRASGELADQIVTTSPDVTVSTNLGGG